MELAPHYGSVAWMYLFQDFSDSARDRRAARVAIRFGITAWPQHLLVDPTDLAVIASTGRSLETFTQAVADVPAINGEATPTAEMLATFEALAERIQTDKGTGLAKQHLGHADIVVRFCATERLAEEDPLLVAEAAVDLLAVQHDQLRFLVCEVLSSHGGTAAASALETLLATPAGSKNPNRLRLMAAKALGRCGDAGSLEILGRFAIDGPPNNMLTGKAVGAIHSIAQGLPSEGPPLGRSRAVELLLRCFPAPAQPPAGNATDEARGRAAKVQARKSAMVRDLALQVHGALVDLTGRDVPFPEVYDAAARAALVEGLGKER